MKGICLVFLFSLFLLSDSSSAISEEDSEKLEQLTLIVKQMNATFTKENAHLKKENEKLKEELRMLKESLAVGGTSGKQRRVPSHPAVAFHVALTNNLVLTRDGENARYDKIITNIGNGYDPLSGRFTVPVKGIYLITATTQSLSENNYVQMNIVKNGVDVAYTWSHRSGTSTAILHLEVNDWVEYQRFSGAMTQPYTLRGADQSSFGGVLISQL